MVVGLIKFCAGAAVIIAPAKVQAALLVLQIVPPIAQSAVKFIKGEKKKNEDEQITEIQQKVEVSWDNIQYEISKKDGSSKQIIQSASGIAKPGRFLAIMGPSGAGKTTLLNILAGQLPASSQAKLCGAVLINGTPIDQSHIPRAYVQQEDLFFSMLTVQETLDTAAAFRLCNSTQQERAAAVEKVINKLGLGNVRDTIVGNAKTRGLSGGEKKRLSVACELLGNPKLIFLDEPTTGLDAFQADKVTQALKQLAMDGCTVVVSIHQPRSSIFAQFDDLILLAGGRIAYNGPASESVAYMGKLGHVCPPNYNPADYLSDIISVDNSSPELQSATEKLVDSLVAAYLAPATTSGAVASSAGAVENRGRRGKGGLAKLKLLLVRSWRQATRDKATNQARLQSNLFSAIVFGCIYWRLKLNQAGVQDRLGLLQVSAVNTCMSSLVKTLQVFPSERTLVSRERTRGSFSVLTYLAAKLVAELPVTAVFPLVFSAVVYPMTNLNNKPDRVATFISLVTLTSFCAGGFGLFVGSFAPTPEAASAIGPALMVIFIVFGGLYTNEESVPLPLRWISKVSMIKNGFEGLSVNEFRGQEYKATKQGHVASGEQVLDRMSFTDGVQKSCTRQLRTLFFFWWTTYCILQARKPKYQTLEPHSEKEAEEGLNGSGVAGDRAGVSAAAAD